MRRKIKRKIRRKRKIAQRFFRNIKDVCAIFFIGCCVLFLGYQIAFGTQISESKLEKETCMVIQSAIGEEHIPLEQYLVGLLAGSIDLSYDDEVLKAQSILLRSSLLRNRENALDSAEKYLLSEEVYPQEYMSVYDMQQLYGRDFDKIYERLRGVVEDTRGTYLSYEGKPILGAFCALSGGKTRSGKDIFQKEEYGYLERVSCEYDITSARYSKNYYFTWKELRRKLIENHDLVETEKGQEIDKISFNIISTDDTGYVTQMEVENKRMSGEEFRTVLHLNSACLEIRELEAGVQIQTKGIGHGFGMSQYMAQSLAEKGFDYIEILSFFYPHGEIEKE